MIPLILNAKYGASFFNCVLYFLLLKKPLKMDVVVCVKNNAIGLDYILNQIFSYIPYKNLIVIYGTSKDQTVEIAKKYTRHVYWDEDKGLGAARGLGIEKAKSELVAMIDSDIQINNDWYYRLIPKFEEEKVAAVMGACSFGHGCPPLEKLWEYYRKTAEFDYGCHNVIFNREIILKVGNFNKNIRGAGEDHDLFRKVINSGYKWVWDKTTIVYQPMGIIEYLKHMNWWEEDPLKFKQGFVYDSPFRFLYRFTRFFFAKFTEAFQYAGKRYNIHPFLIIYIPIIDFMIVRKRFLMNIKMRKSIQVTVK